MSVEKNVFGVIKLRGGTEKKVIGSRGKYWLCEDCQFLKSKYRIYPAQRKESAETEELEKKGKATKSKRKGSETE